MRIQTCGPISILINLSLANCAVAGNDSNYLQLINGVDALYPGLYNPHQSPSNVTNGFWRCIPSDVLHAPTRVIDPQDPQVGKYAAKVNSLHFTSCASTGAVATWPTIALSSGDSDCRAVVNGNLNFGIMSSTPLGGSNDGWFIVGPTSGSQVNLLALIFNTSFPGPHVFGPTGAIVYGVDLKLDSLVGASAIRVPEDQSLTYWMAFDRNQPPGVYQYMAGSENETSICSSLSFFASGVAATTQGIAGAIFGSPTQREWGMFVGTLDATLNLATNVGIPGGTGVMLGAANPAMTGTGARTISLSSGPSSNPVELTFLTYDGGNAFGGSGKLVFCNLMATNSLGLPSCGPWSPGYTALPAGGPGGPVLSTTIPQQPRLVGKLDSVALTLLQNPVWVLSTNHNVLPGGAPYPMFPGFSTALGGSTGNTGGAPLIVRSNPAFVGMGLFFSEVNLDPPSRQLAVASNNGHSNTNGFATLFFP